MLDEKQSIKHRKISCTSRTMLLEVKAFEQLDAVMARLEDLANAGNTVFFSFPLAARIMAFVTVSIATQTRSDIRELD